MWMRVSASTTRVFVAFSIVNLVFPLYERRAARVSRAALLQKQPAPMRPSRRQAAEQQAAAGALRQAQKALHKRKRDAARAGNPLHRPACQPGPGTHAPHAGRPPHLARQAPDAPRQVLSAQRLHPVTRGRQLHTQAGGRPAAALRLKRLPHMGLARGGAERMRSSGARARSLRKRVTASCRCKAAAQQHPGHRTEQASRLSAERPSTSRTRAEHVPSSRQAGRSPPQHGGLPSDTRAGETATRRRKQPRLGGTQGLAARGRAP